MIVYKIPDKTALKIKGVEYTNGVIFNPIQDVDGNYILSAEELKNWNKNLHFTLEDDLEPINYNPILIDLL